MSLESHETDCTVQINESVIPLASQEQQQWEKRSIYRVPPFITKLNAEAYMPQVVSFGPYHHGEDHLRPMEEHKRRALTHFLNRSGKTLEGFLEPLSEVAPELEESYDALDPKWKESREFLELMITDGCFMLEIMRSEIMRRENEENEKNGKNEKNEKNDYEANDPIFSPYRLAYITPYIRRDMLMLENQLPMLVLEHLVAVKRDGEEGKDYINALILKFCSLDLYVEETGRSVHVLEVYRKRWLMPKKERSGSKADGDRIIRSATELNEAGIQFKKSGARSLEAISFGGGVLRLPVITVDDATESTFLNMMTFERLHIGAGTEVTSYVTFMDNIINNERDVALLRAEDIIQNALESDKAVAELFNKLCKEVKLESNNSLDAVQKKISAHCKKPRNMSRAAVSHTLSRIQSSNGYITLSIVAGIFLFALTIIQTVYTGLGYYK